MTCASVLPRCIGDGGRSSVVALQGEATNRPRTAAVKSRGGERRGRRRPIEGVRCDPLTANVSEPLMTCRKSETDIKTGYVSLPWDEPGGSLFIGQVVSGMKAARAWVGLLCGTWNLSSRRMIDQWLLVACGWLFQGRLQAAGTVRRRVLMRGTGTDRLVVVMRMQPGEERRRAVCGRTARTVRGGGGRHQGSVGNAARPERLPPTLLTFRLPTARKETGELFVGFMPAVSDDALKVISRTIKRWRLHAWTGATLTSMAREINPIVRGWVNYYGRFYLSRLNNSLRRIDEYLVRWALRKYKRLNGRFTRAWKFLNNVVTRQPGLFAHWRVTQARVRMVGAV